MVKNARFVPLVITTKGRYFDSAPPPPLPIPAAPPIDPASCQGKILAHGPGVEASKNPSSPTVTGWMRSSECRWRTALLIQACAGDSVVVCRGGQGCAGAQHSTAEGSARQGACSTDLVSLEPCLRRHVCSLLPRSCSHQLSHTRSSHQLTCIASGGTWEACLQRGSLHTSQAAMVSSLRYCTPVRIGTNIGTPALVSVPQAAQPLHLPRCTLHKWHLRAEGEERDAHSEPTALRNAACSLSRSCCRLAHVRACRCQAWLTCICIAHQQCLRRQQVMDVSLASL